MHVQDCYIKAVEEAKQKVKEKYGLDHHDYDNDHEAHKYWLKCYNAAFHRFILKGE